MTNKEIRKKNEYDKRFNRSWCDFVFPLLKKHQEPIKEAIVSSAKKDGKSTVPYFNDRYRAFKMFEMDDLKIVILGQDPYPGMTGDQPVANGLAFSTRDKKVPESLKIMLQKMEEGTFDTEALDSNPTVEESWGEYQAKQGVLLLNTALTTPQGVRGGHMKAWKPFTAEFIHKLAKEKKGIVWLLMGAKALDFVDVIKSTNNNHRIVGSSHPSPLGRHKECRGYPAFVKTNVFYEVNEALTELGKEPIDWQYKESKNGTSSN